MIKGTADSRELRKLNRDLGIYQRLSKKTPAETLEKQGGKLRFELFREFRKEMPARGSIRAELLGRLRRGLGVYVRPSVIIATMARFITVAGKRGRKRKLNHRAVALKREIALRESGRGFLGYGMRQPAWKPFSRVQAVKGRNKTFSSFGRYRNFLGKVEVKTANDANGSLRILSVVPGAAKVGRRRGIVSRAITNLRRDMRVYIERKQRQHWKKARR